MKNRNTSRLRRRNGAALLIVSMVLVLGFALVSATMSGAVVTYRNVGRQVNMERAHFLAETGLQLAADRIVNYVGAFPASVTASGSIDGGTWSYTVTRLAWRTYAVEASGQFRGFTRRLKVGRSRYPTFGDFGNWTANMGSLWTIPGQSFTGKYYSGSRMNIWSSAAEGGPIWYGKVFSAADSFNGTWQWATFNEGYTLGSVQGSLSQVDFTEMLGEAQTYGMVLEGPTRIGFSVVGGVGKINIRNTRKWPDGNTRTFNTSAQEIIYIKDAGSSLGSVELTGGTLKGKLSVFAEDDITMQGSTLMSDNPETNPNSADKLGLITKKNLWTGTSAPNNVKTQAALLATGQKSGGGKHGVVNYNSTSVGPRGIRYVYGSQAVAETAAAGTFNQSTGLQTAGYRSSISHDPRFLSNPPPYYPPLSDKLLFEDWAYVGN